MTRLAILIPLVCLLCGCAAPDLVPISYERFRAAVPSFSESLLQTPPPERDEAYEARIRELFPDIDFENAKTLLPYPRVSDHQEVVPDRHYRVSIVHALHKMEHPTTIDIYRYAPRASLLEVRSYRLGDYGFQKRMHSREAHWRQRFIGYVSTR